MPPTRRLIRQRPAVPDLGPVVGEYLLNRSTRERASVHENKLKAGLMQVLEQVGQPDGDEGEHRKLVLEEPLEFVTYKGEKGTKKTVIGIQRQYRKGSMVLNEDRVMAFLQGEGRARLLDTCTTTQVVINEDALLAANFEGEITDKDLAALYDEGKPTFAFILITDEE